MLKKRSQASDIPVDQNGFADLLQTMLQEFDGRFAEFRTHEEQLNIFAYPFTRVEPAKVSLEFQMEMIDLQASNSLRDKFEFKSLLEFYGLYLPKAQYPQLYLHAMRMISLFGSTYRCEQLFSSMKFTKNKYRSRLTDGHIEDCLRLSTSVIRPDIHGLIRKKQFQVSH